MAEIVDFSAALAIGTGGGAQRAHAYKSVRANATVLTFTAGSYVSMWRTDGMPGGALAVPSGVEIPTRATAGALGQNNAASGKELWLVGGEMAGISHTSSLLVYDRLLHAGGLSGTDTSPQSVGGTLTRHTSGVGNLIFIELWTGVGTTPTTISATYTNQSGVSGRTTKAVAIGGTGLRETHSLIALPFADGDNGARSIQSVTLADSTGQVGDLGVVLAHPLLTIIGLNGQGTTANATGYWSGKNLFLQPEGLKLVEDDACIAFAMRTHGIRAPEFHADLFFMEQ